MSLRLLAIAAALLVAQAHGSAAQTVVSDAGVGKLTAQTRFDAAVVATAFPGATVGSGVYAVEGTKVPTLEVKIDGQQVLTVFGNDRRRLERIEVLTPAFATSTGVKVGTRFAAVFPQTSQTKCTLGIDLDAGSVFCPAPGLNNVHLIFKGEAKVPENQWPPSGVLAGWKVATVFWVSPD